MKPFISLNDHTRVTAHSSGRKLARITFFSPEDDPACPWTGQAGCCLPQTIIALVVPCPDGRIIGSQPGTRWDLVTEISKPPRDRAPFPPHYTSDPAACTCYDSLVALADENHTPLTAVEAAHAQ